MEAESKLNELLAIAQKPGAYLAKWREQNDGGRACGCVHCMPSYVPEEILDAAGVLPVGVWGGDRQVARAEALMQPFACSMARTALEIGMEGHLEILDGMAFATCCDTLKNLAEIWKHQFPGKFHHSIVFPVQQNPASGKTFLLHELRLFAKAVGEWTGIPASGQALENSLNKYEESRNALRELAAFRIQHPQKLRAAEFSKIVQAASCMDRADFTVKAKALLDALPGRDNVLTGKKKILITGTLPMPYAMLEVIEEAGGVVVADDLGLGQKYFERTLNQDGTPIERLASSLLSHSPVSTIHHGVNTRASHILGLAREAGAEAVIINATKFCEPEFFDYPDLKKDLDAASVPGLLLETEMGTESVGTLSTRIGAFLESLD